jgi:hypothetical protein
MIRLRRDPFLVVCILFALVTSCRTARAQSVTATLKGTVSVTAAGQSARPELFQGATLTLVNRDIKASTFRTTSGATGDFTFRDLPAGNYNLTVQAQGFPPAAREISLVTGGALVVEFVLTPSVTEAVTVRQEEGLLSAGDTVTSNTIRADKLEELPLRADNYQGALPLTPSIVRDASGRDHIKGTGAGESSYTVNGADVTDPVTGNLAFDIPLEAAANVHVEDNPYSAEFGRTTGGVSNLETRTGGDKFKLGATRVFPTFHAVIGGKLDSFRPRITFEGPLIKKRISFLQAFEYRFSRIYVPSLSPPHDNSTSEAFNSFTQLDVAINNTNRLKFAAAFFPERKRFVGLNTFNPPNTTPNTKQRGKLLSVSEQAIFPNQSFLASLFAYKTFSLDVFGQGAGGLILFPDQNAGSYFANTSRSAARSQWQEQYFFRTLNLFGQHSLRIGGEFDHTRLSARFDFNPIQIRRRDRTLSKRIDFAGPTFINRPLTEVAGFVQDRWVINPRITLEGGLRFDENNISSQLDISPRISLMYLPFSDDRTIIRAGIGLFYDRSPLSNRYFELQSLNDDNDETNPIPIRLNATNFPMRIVTIYAPDGQTVIDGPRRYMNVSRGRLEDANSLRWSLQLDRRLAKHLTLRGGFLHRYTQDLPIVYPQPLRNGNGVMILKSSGIARYREVQLLALYDSPRFHNWTISYVWSRAQGSLNTSDNILSDFPAFVVRPDVYATLPFDIPHRLLAYGDIKVPHGFVVMPAVEIRSGFPFSFVDDRLNYVGTPNHARFPIYMSLDTTILKSFTVPFLDKKARAGVILFNLTNHFNPRDVQSNVGSLHLGEFFNSLGTSVRAKFELDF